MRRCGCIVTGHHQPEPVEPHGIQIHHVLGEQARRGKVKVGGWYILPLHWRMHDISSGVSVNVTTHRAAFVEKYGSEKFLFFKMLFAFWVAGIAVPVPTDVLNAIAEHSER